MSGLCFNSKLVRLKAGKTCAVMWAIFTCFNSKLVRLKANSGVAGARFLPMFQFQTGAIKSL